MQCGSVQHCRMEAVCCSACGSVRLSGSPRDSVRLSISLAVCDSAGGGVWQCLRQCVAVRQQCGSVRQCVGVRQCAAV
jgi:hypothetical protein